MRPDEIDAVTLDAFGTLLELRDPVGELQRLVPDRPRDAIAKSFALEAEYYAAHAVETRDDATVASLHEACTRVFNDALGTALSPAEYNGALKFAVMDGVREALVALRARGLALAVVANWDFSLHRHLEEHGLRPFFATVVTAGEAGARKPDARPFLLALERMRVEPARALHVGDHPEHDGAGAGAVGLHFAPAPLADVVAAWA